MWLIAVQEYGAIACRFHPVSTLEVIDISWLEVISILASMEINGNREFPFLLGILQEKRLFPCDYVLAGPRKIKPYYTVALLGGFNVFDPHINRVFMALSLQNHEYDLYYHLKSQVKGNPVEYEGITWRAWAALHGASVLFELMHEELDEVGAPKNLREHFLTQKDDILRTTLLELSRKVTPRIAERAFSQMAALYNPVFAIKCIEQSNQQGQMHLALYRCLDDVLDWANKYRISCRIPETSPHWILFYENLLKFMEYYAIPLADDDCCFTDKLHICDPWDPDEIEVDYFEGEEYIEI
jgi:hypothetical protein